MFINIVMKKFSILYNASSILFNFPSSWLVRLFCISCIYTSVPINKGYMFYDETVIKLNEMNKMPKDESDRD